MAADSIGEVWNYRGKGVVSYSMSSPGIALGIGGETQRKASIKIPLPRPEGSEASTGFLSIGVITPPGLRLPVRWKITLNNTSISRELRPQVSSSLDDGQTYHKVVFDVTPLARMKLSGREVHQLTVIYDGFQPILLNDVTLAVLFEDEESRTSASLFSGAKSLEPGGKVIVYSRLGEYLGGVRRAAAMIYAPSTQSRLRFVAGGSEPRYSSGPGAKAVETEVPYKGYEVPVAVVYEEPENPIYPKTAVASDIVVVENSVEGPLLELKDVSIERAKAGKAVMTLQIRNRGSRDCDSAKLTVMAEDLTLAVKELGSIPQASALENLVEFYLPPHVSRINVRIEWKVKGFPLVRDAIVNVKP